MLTNSIEREREIRKFHVALAQRRLRNVARKKRAARAKFFFLLIRSIVVSFAVLVVFTLFSITRFYIFFEETINIKESFAFFSLLINKYTKHKLTIIRCQSQRLIWRWSESCNVLLSYNENKN